MIKMILATGINFELGKNNKLLWNIPEDLKYFKEQTEGQYVVMGMNTFKSLPFPKGLPNRKNIVLTRQDLSVNKRVIYQYNPRYFTWFTNNLDFLKDTDNGDVWIIGGASIYDQLIDFVDEVHFTFIEKNFSEADTFLTKRTIDKLVNEFDNGERIKSGYDENSNTHFVINILKRIKEN